MNLVGHREAGKTSLATRLMGQKFREDIFNTEGVAIHHIESTFNKDEGRGSTWNETNVSIIQLLKDYTDAVLARTKKAHSVERKKQLGDTKANSKKLNMNKQSKVTKREGYQKQPVKSDPCNEHLANYPVETKGQQYSSEKTIKQNEMEQGNHSMKANQELQSMKDNGKYEPSLHSISKETGQEATGEQASDFKSTQSIVASPVSEKLKHDIEKIQQHKASLAHKEHNSDAHMAVTLWDLGGQNEFLTTHHLFLDAESTTLIVMDITKPLHQMLDKDPKLGQPNTPAEVLKY